MNRRARELRFTALRESGCLTCPGCGAPEVHHQNAGGHAGQKRLGDEFTICLGAWAHRGVPLDGYNASQMYAMFGPSLARHPREFRQRYGTDAEQLARANALIEPTLRRRVA